MTRELLRDAPIIFAGVLAVAGLGVLFTKSSTGAAWALVGVYATTQAAVPPLDLQITEAGTTLYGLDLVAGLMLVIGLARLTTRTNPPSLSLPLVVLSLLFVLHLARGFGEFGLQAAVNSSRPWLYLLGPLVYASQGRPRWTRASFLPLIAGATALSVFALVQIARYGLYGANEFIDIRGQLVDARPVTATGALLIVQCVLIAAAARFVRSSLWFLAIATMGTAALLLQHRTVWIVAVVVAVIAYVKWAHVAIFMNERAALGAASAILFVVPIVLILAGSSNAFKESVESATGQGTTLSWRTESWTSLIEAHSSPQELLVGIPAGTSLERRIDDTIAVESPHSIYVDALLTFGVLGPLLIAWLWLQIVRRRQTAAAALQVSVVAVVLIVATEVAFGITNMLGPVQGLLTGMLLQAAYAPSHANLRGREGETAAR